MALEWTDDGRYLQPGRHVATLEEIETTLVGAFPGSTTRSRLFDRYELIRRAILRLVPIREQWLNGSFVSDKLDPGDIDVVTVLDSDHTDQLDDAEELLLSPLLAQDFTRDIHGCHSFAVAYYPDGHAARAEYEAQAAYWDRQWGHDRDDRAKGYIVVMGDA
jgi:hypothetical protein